MAYNNNNMNMFDNNLSVYIPRITNEWAEEIRIANVFHANELGIVERVDLVQKQTPEGTSYYEGFVHMKWFDTQSTRNIQARIMDSTRDARLVHEDPNYWLLLKNKNPMSAAEVRLEKRIVELETQVNAVQHQMNIMNYWNDPALQYWRSPDHTIAPMWCHPVNEATPAQTPLWWCDDVDTTKTMNSYANDTENFQAEQYYEDEDNVCDYYDYDPYDMEILE